MKKTLIPKALRYAVFTLPLLVLSSPGHTTVTSWGFLQGGFFFGLSEADASSLKATIQDTLSGSPDAKVVRWESADGKRAGKIYPRFSYESRGTHCRRTYFQLKTEDRDREDHRLDLCWEDNQWRVVDAPATLDAHSRNQAIKFLNGALTHAPQGEPLHWFSEKSGHSAHVVMLSDPGSDMGDCRDVAISLSDKEGRSMGGRYRFCLGDSGQWLYRPGNTPQDD